MEDQFQSRANHLLGVRAGLRKINIVLFEELDHPKVLNRFRFDALQGS